MSPQIHSFRLQDHILRTQQLREHDQIVMARAAPRLDERRQARRQLQERRELIAANQDAWQQNRTTTLRTTP